MSVCGKFIRVLVKLGIFSKPTIRYVPSVRKVEDEDV